MFGTLSHFISREEILDTVNSLFVGTDSKDWEAVRKSLAPSLHLDMTSMVGGEPSQIDGADLAAAWETGLSALEAVHHQTGNFRVTVNGEEAEVFCYGTASHYRRVRSGKNTRVFVGSYDFKLRLMGPFWRITSMCFTLKFIDGNRELDTEEAG